MPRKPPTDPVDDAIHYIRIAQSVAGPNRDSFLGLAAMRLDEAREVLRDHDASVEWVARQHNLGVAAMLRRSVEARRNVINDVAGNLIAVRDGA